MGNLPEIIDLIVDELGNPDARAEVAQVIERSFGFFRRYDTWFARAGKAALADNAKEIGALFFAGKLIVSAACFWYALRQINVSEAVSTLPTFDFHWAAFAVAVAMAQILLLALRLWSVVHALTPNAVRLTYVATSAVSAIYALLAQVLPSVVGE